MIRKVEKENIPECVEVIKASFLTVANDLGFTTENAPGFTAFATTAERLNGQFEEGRPMFAYYTDENQIVGYYSLQMQENKECELNNLCVLPEYRHQNIGEQLLEHAFSYAKESGITQMNLGIVEENTKLRKWYESYGVEHIGTKKFDFFPFTCGYMKKEI